MNGTIEFHRFIDEIEQKYEWNDRIASFHYRNRSKMFIEIDQNVNGTIEFHRFIDEIDLKCA